MNGCISSKQAALMKYLTLLLSILLLGCADTQVGIGDLTGTWRLVEILADPGDGSGTFQPVDSDNTIQFFNDLTFQTNNSLCGHLNPDSQTSVGAVDTTQMTLVIDGCEYDGLQVEYHFELNEYGQFILYFPCIEPCANKYIKILSDE